jgi:hypothetical protein
MEGYNGAISGVRWRKFMNPIDWIAWIYGKFFQGHPYVGGAVVLALWMMVGLVMWVRGVDKYKEEHPTQASKDEAQKSDSPARHSPAPPRQERLVILSQIVTEYQDAHNMQMPTFEWINKRLKEQGADFRVDPPTPPPGGMMFHGGRFEGNGTAIENHNPNARFTFDGTDFINNKKGIVNTFSSEQQGKPKQP